jgi:aldehyde dehydrogenase (NAD+)
LAPDYILTTSDVKPKLIEAIKAAVIEYYSEDPKQSPDYSRIINQRHFDRLEPLLQSGTVAFGGRTDRADLFIEPTLLDNVEIGSKVMQDEIFGPILPILTVSDVDEAIDIVNSREKPLASYIFSRDKTIIDKVLANTTSGGVTVNDAMLHIAVDSLPFGGVGNSGIGNYHGQFGFDACSHKKAVLRRQQNLESALWIRYPPFDDAKFKWAKRLTARYMAPQLCGCLRFVLTFLLGLLSACVLFFGRSFL